MIRWFAILTLLLAPLSAGCIAGDEGALDAAATDGGADDADGNAAANAPPGGEQGAAETAGATQTGGPVFAPHTVDWSGALPVAYCAPMGPNACVGMEVTPGEDSLELKFSAIAGGELTLTWDAPPGQELVLGVRTYESCGETCRVSTDGYSADVQGPSGVSLTLPEGTVPDGQMLLVTVSMPRFTPSPVYAHASVGQAFHVQGEMVAAE